MQNRPKYEMREVRDARNELRKLIKSVKQYQQDLLKAKESLESQIKSLPFWAIWRRTFRNIDLAFYEEALEFCGEVLPTAEGLIAKVGRQTREGLISQILALDKNHIGFRSPSYPLLREDVREHLHKTAAILQGNY